MKKPLNPPSEAELDWLEEFLLNRIDEDIDVGDLDEGILDLSALDGFFCAIVSGPEMVPPSLWIPSLWGDFETDWANEQEAEKVLTLMVRYMNSVAAFLINDPKNFEPMFMEREVKGKVYTSVDDWCDGYIRGVHLTAAQWQMESKEMVQLLAPIKAFSEEYEMQTLEQISQDEIENLQQAITPNILKIHDYWLARRSNEPDKNMTFRHDEKHPGRNDICFCGSGKKYKKCCLH